MRQDIDQLHVKGSVLVIKNGKTLLKYATANKTDTSYLINSVQKSMTAAMVMQEVQKKKLKLSDKLKKFYPDVEGSSSVTIANLLDMTSGLDIASGEYLGTTKFVSEHDNMQSNIKKTVFDKAMLGKWHYTSLNYVYLCGILSKLENKDYEEIFRKTYIDKLNLKHTEFLWADKKKLQESHWVPGYEKKDGKYVKVSYKDAVRDAHNELGAGSIVMSNDDLAKSIRYILNGSILTANSRKILFKGEAPSYYNGGLYNLKDYESANGAGEGYYTFMRSTRDGKDMIIIQANYTAEGKFSKIKKKVNHIMSMMMQF